MVKSIGYKMFAGWYLRVHISSVPLGIEKAGIASYQNSSNARLRAVAKKISQQTHCST